MTVPTDEDLVVGQRDRISIDVSDIREEIEGCRSDVAWTELSLAAKIRTLVKERLEEIRREKEAAERDDL